MSLMRAISANILESKLEPLSQVKATRLGIKGWVLLGKGGQRVTSPGRLAARSLGGDSCEGLYIDFIDEGHRGVLCVDRVIAGVGWRSSMFFLQLEEACIRRHDDAVDLQGGIDEERA